MMDEHAICFNTYSTTHKYDIRLLMVIVILPEAVIEEILARNLLGYLISLEHQVTISWKLGII